MLQAIAITVALVAALSASAAAQGDYRQREGDLASLSSAFGALHHLRRLCEPARESDLWRERMKALIELERPQPNARAQMVARFNDAYRDANRRFSACDRRARDVAAARAAAAAAPVARLLESLPENEAGIAQLGNEPPTR